MPKRNSLMKAVLAIALLPLLLLSTQAFGQSSSGIGGVVSDVSQAVLPGATVTATNQDTGVATKATANNAGSYNFPSLQPGIYQVAVEMKGFQKSTKTDVKLGASSQIKLNFELVVAGVATEVEVTTSAENLVLESGSSTGTILQSETLAQLPNASNDVLDLINLMGGVVKAEDTIFGNAQQTFAGVPGANINLQRDGVTVNELRYSSGIVSPTRVNPEMVGEFKMILSPVDAEMGRGAGQVQILTKSGANAFHGAGVWNIQNTALDANEWGNKNRLIPATPNWRNLNNYTLSASGPVIKNKTFFFASWDQQIVRTRAMQRPPVLTECAKKGIYRYMDGWIPGNINTSPVFTGVDPVTGVGSATGTQTQPVTDEVGNPLTLLYRNSTEFNAKTPTLPAVMRYESVFGPLTAANRAILGGASLTDPIYNDCAGFNISLTDVGIGTGTPWDANRAQYDQSGYIERFSGLMNNLPANSFLAGDGLNTGQHAWMRTTHGGDSVFGSGMDNERKSITIKIDHNINSAHRVSGTYTYEKDFGQDAENTWPEPYGYGGAVFRTPQSFMISVTSTIRPTLLNEFRMGLSRTETATNEPLNGKDGDKMEALLQDLMPTADASLFPNYTGFPIIIQPGSGLAGFYTDSFFKTNATSNPYGSRGNLPTTWGGYDPRWSFGDTITWSKGAHSFKGGLEFRRNQSWQKTNGAAGFFFSSNTFPAVEGGSNSTYSSLNGTLPAASWPGMIGFDLTDFKSGTYSNAWNLNNYLTGSVGTVRQWFYTQDAQNPRWNDATEGELQYETDLRNKEFSAFFKDDWKVNSALTLNLGVRWEYYGTPWVKSGLAIGYQGGADSVFGVTGVGTDNKFGNWMMPMPVNLGEEAYTTPVTIGPNSANPDIELFQKVLNNFGPAVGFAYQLPWFGKGKTTLRGGYQISYQQISNFDNNAPGFGGILAYGPALTYNFAFTGDANHRYMKLSNLGNEVPLHVPGTCAPGAVGCPDLLPASIQPLKFRPVTDRSQTLDVFDENIKNPYTQSLNMSLTRNVGSNITVDVRYIATLSRKLISAVNLNSVNFINNGLLNDLAIARTGGTTALLDQIAPVGAFSTTLSGGAALRASSLTRTNLATGNLAGVAGTLATTNGTYPVSTIPTGVVGEVIRRAGLPENFIYANPQYATANYRTNLNHANYHSMQVQVTMRPTRGFSFQTTYTWSRNLADAGVTDWRDRTQDYRLSGQHRTHNVSTYGTFELPFGANGFLFRNSTGVLKKAIEGWQLSWIASLVSGAPLSVSGAVNRLWAGGTPDLVGPQYWDNKSGKVVWIEGAASGNYFANANGSRKYMSGNDPQCDTLPGYLTPTTANTMYSLCRNGIKALYVRNPDGTQGPIVFQHSPVGVKGNWQPGNLTGTGRLSLDMALGKSIEFMEGKRVELRVDAQNIMNHPTASQTNGSYNIRTVQISDADTAITSGNFGNLQFKSQHRTFQARIRITF